MSELLSPGGDPRRSNNEPNAEALADVVHNGPLGLVLTDANGVIRWVNSTLSGWLGYRSGELQGRRTFQELLAPGGRIYYDTHVRPLLHMQCAANEIALELVRSDGSRLSVLIHSRLRHDGGDDALIVETVVFDATERRRYEQELLRERRLAEQSEARLQVMYAITSGLAAATSVDDIVTFVAQRASESMIGARCAVWMFDDGRRSAVQLSAVDVDAAGPASIALPEHAPALDQLASGQLVVISDRAESQSRYPLVCDWMAANGASSAVIAPLFADGTLHGAISYGFTEAHEFDAAELRAASALATQAEQALQRARLLSAELRSKQRMETLLEFTASLSGALTLDDVIDAVAYGSHSLLGAIGVRVALVDVTGRSVEFVRGTGIGGRLGLAISIEARSIGCTAIRTGVMQIVTSREELEERFPDSPILSDPQFGRVIGVPLRRGSEVLGAWVLAFRDTATPDSDDLKLIELFATQAGQATQRAALHNAENAARVQADLRRVMSAALNRAVTASEVGQAITQEGRRAFDSAGLAVFVADRRNPWLLLPESRSGLDDAAVASSARVDDVALLGDLSEWTSPRFITGRSEVAAILVGIIEDVDWEAAAVMPLSLAGRVLGLIVIGFDRDDALGTATQVALSGIAAEAGVALARALRSDVDHDVAITLQRTLLPTIGPVGTDWSVTTSYEPGSELLVVGGDLFDVTQLDDGRLVLVVGDVVGHGLEAAASMGLLRSAAKALTLVGSGPADVISGLQAFAAVTPGVRYSSVCYVEVRPDGSGRYACAGHPLPVLRHPDGRTELLDKGRSPLLGVTAATPLDADLHMTEGSTLVIYTDGLIERRGTTTDQEVARLRSYLGSASFPEATARHVLEAMLGVHPTQDDIVVVCLTRTSHRSPAC